MMEDSVKLFVSLTEAAIKEENEEKFLEILKERDAVLSKLHLFEPTWIKEEHIESEKRIIERLLAIKRKLLREMESLWKKKRSLTSYTPKFPYLPAPSFFDEEG